MKNQITDTDKKLLAALALAIVEKPRANLQELASTVGISKTTLYRFCRTRNDLFERLISHSTTTLINTVEEHVALDASHAEILKSMANSFLEHRELTLFLIHSCEEDIVEYEELDKRWNIAFNAFFLKGQQNGTFRIDLTASALGELWMSIIIGFIDAERRGRVARANLSSVIVSCFLNGSAGSHLA